MKVLRVKATGFWGVFQADRVTLCFWSRDKDECRAWLAANS